MQLVLLLFAILPVAALGCRHSTQGPNYGGQDGNKIARLVDQMNDESNTIPKLKAAFASGTTIGKKDLKTFPRYRYEIKGAPSVNGDSATATVEVSEQTRSDGGSEKEWTFVKEGADWKIKSAPLP